MAKKLKTPENIKDLPKHTVKEMLDLATSSFGLVAALAWNELIKELVNEIIRPIFGEGSGIISLLVYAVFVTLLAILVTFNLGRLAKARD